MTFYFVKNQKKYKQHVIAPQYCGEAIHKTN
jgi:hypothetical protein